MSAENSGQLSRPDWAVDSCIRYMSYRINLPSVNDPNPRFPSDAPLRPPTNRQLPRAPFFLGYAISQERNGITGAPLWFRVLRAFWIVCEETSAGVDSTWVFTRLCQASYMSASRWISPSFSMVKESWARWDAFMDTEWSSLQQKHARIVPNEKYMLWNGQHQLFDRLITKRIRRGTETPIVEITWTPNLQRLKYAQTDNPFTRPTTPALTEKQIEDWHQINAPYEDDDEENDDEETDDENDDEDFI